MLSKKIMLLMPCMVLGVVCSAVGGAAPDRTVERVDVGRQEILRRCDLLVHDGNKFIAAGEYDKAIRNFIQAKKQLMKYSTGSQFKDKITICDRRIEDCYMAKADEAMRRADARANVGDFEEALKMCREAQRYCPEHRDTLAKKIVFYEKRRDAALNRENRSINKLDADKAARDYQMQVLLEHGRRLVKRREFIAAKRKFEDILLLDPYNEDALQALLGVNTRIKREAGLRADATARHAIGQVEWGAAMPFAYRTGDNIAGNNLVEPEVKEVSKSSTVEDKLKKFRGDLRFSSKTHTFAGAVSRIAELTRLADPEKRGVNFIIKDHPTEIKKNEAGSDGGEEEDDEEYEETEETADGGDGENKEAPKIVYLEAFDMRNASVFDILSRLKERGDLDFRIGENEVFVAAKGLPLEKVEVKVFSLDLPKHLTQQKALKDRLAADGILIGPSHYVVPMPNHVVVGHTPENLKKIEKLLEKYAGNQTKMVQVMFKFIEVSQKDLDELAFNWQYSNSKMSFSNALLRHYVVGKDDDDFDGSAQAGMEVDNEKYGKSAGFTWSDSKNNLKVGIYALDWADNSNVLYTPRVTTLSGQTAHINMSEKHYYPEDWETIDTESNENFRITATPQPDLDDEQDLGITFSVTPEVIGDDLIKVPVNIPIKQFYGWLIADSRNPNDDDDDGEYTKKPIFTKREINTMVTVKDGETVLIGSIASDITRAIRDKMPIIGDLPFVGRLFQSRYTNSQKVNLLVFITCRIIKPDGSPYNPNRLPNVGLPILGN